MRNGAVLACCAGAAVMSGCIPPETSKQMAENDSVLAPLFLRATERDAVAWANDEFNADKRARGTAMLAYSKNGDDPNYVNYLYVKHLTDSDSNVRATAAFALALHGTPDQVPMLVPLLKDEDRFVRRNAVIALQRLHNPAAVEGLMTATEVRKEPEASIRAEAADALGQYAEPRVLQRLIAALDDPSLIVNKAAYTSLKTLTGEAMEPDRRAWSTWAAQASSPFDGRRAYQYPAFSRATFWSEYLPFIAPPPNEESAEPIGAPPVSETTGRGTSQSKDGA
ncbi:MAG: HEAT repeat domain-containing protein [Phycisphaerales bacterium]